MRSAALCQLSTLPLPLLIQFIYPKMYSLHDMPDDAGLADEQSGETVLPPPINLTSACLAPYGLYLIDDGQTQFLWVGRDAVPQLLEDVFGLPDKSHLKVGKQTVPVLENDFNERVRAVIERSRDHRGKGVGSIIVPHLYVVREDGEPGMRLWATTMLVEDRADQGVSLKQWLGMMGEKVSLSRCSMIYSSPLTPALGCTIIETLLYKYRDYWKHFVQEAVRSTVPRSLVADSTESHLSEGAISFTEFQSTRLEQHAS